MRSTVEGRLLIASWSLLAAVAVTLVVVLAATDFVVTLSEPFFVFMFFLASTLATLSFILIWKGSARWPNLSHSASVLAQLILAGMLIGPLSYIAATANYPFQDKNLHAIDQFLWLDWRPYLKFVDEHGLGSISKIGYSTFVWQPFLVPIVLCLRGYVARSYQFALAFLLTMMITVVISMFLPAAGTYTFFGLSPSDYPNLHPSDDFDHMRHLPLLREGKMRLMEIGRVKGIVTFPSFHAAGGFLYLWALWAVWWMRPIALVCNGLLLLATPIDGGHYFIDVIAGVALAVCSIWIVQKLSRTLERGLIYQAPPVPRATLS
jgi:membrane-associated phospholipid phosphatase